MCIAILLALVGGSYSLFFYVENAVGLGLVFPVCYVL